MDNQVKILLGNQKNTNSINTNSYGKIELFNNVSELTEFGVNDDVNSTEVFDNEREANAVYRIYGGIEYLSLLNGLKNNIYSGSNNYKIFEDFFSPTYSNTSKSLIKSFDFYLVKAAPSGYTKIIVSEKYVRYFEVIATPLDFEIYPAGFSNNVYGEQKYAFSFKKDFDVSQYFDNFNFPATELFLFAQYKTTRNGYSVDETMKFTRWETSGVPIIGNYTPTTFNVGDYLKTADDYLIGDLIEYDLENFSQTQLTEQTIYITTNCMTSDNVTKNVVWKYNPFIPFRLRYFTDVVNRANTGSTSYDIINSIPEYATKMDDNGNYCWRGILPQGYVEPLSGIGIDCPFINGKRYLFSSIVFTMSPDLSDTVTATLFNEIWYTKNAININKLPLSDLSDIGKPCQ